MLMCLSMLVEHFKGSGLNNVYVQVHVHVVVEHFEGSGLNNVDVLVHVVVEHFKVNLVVLVDSIQLSLKYKKNTIQRNLAYRFFLKRSIHIA